MDHSVLAPLLSEYGLKVSGIVPIEANDGLPEWGSLLLISPIDGAFWRIFQASPEFADNHSDPVDRWSQRIISQIADQIGGQAIFPFQGPPFYPFYDWAVRSGRATTSPINLLCHDETGLFVSYRGAIAVPEQHLAAPQTSPCRTCAAPCKTACPVDAFATGVYDVDRCKTYLRQPDGQDCMKNGCRARRACPVGAALRPTDMSAYFMTEFLK